MRKVQTIAVIVGLLFSLTASAGTRQTPEVANRIEPLPRDLEIQLALSALPSRLRDNATVYVLNPMDSTRLLLAPAMIRSRDPGP